MPYFIHSFIQQRLFSIPIVRHGAKHCIAWGCSNLVKFNFFKLPISDLVKNTMIKSMFNPLPSFTLFLCWHLFSLWPLKVSNLLVSGWSLMLLSLFFFPLKTQLFFNICHNFCRVLSFDPTSDPHPQPFLIST